MAKKQYNFLTDDHPARTGAKYDDWTTKDAQIRIRLQNHKEPKISGSMVFFPIANYGGVPRECILGSITYMHRTYDLHQTFFSLIIDNMSLEDYYAKLAEPISTYISVIQKQCQSIGIAHFLFGFSLGFDPIRAQLFLVLLQVWFQLIVPP